MTLLPIIDFTHSAMLHRLQYGGGKQQMLAKACGLNLLKSPHIIDACAGLGNDGFILASLGAQVTMMERHKNLYQALEQALIEASTHPKTQLITQRIRVLEGNAIELLRTHSADVIYLDPMFPKSNKSALNKQSMRILTELVGLDEDADQLLPIALKQAKYRVVVKRPIDAPLLHSSIEPTYQLRGKANRYDIYVNEGVQGKNK